MMLRAICNFVKTTVCMTQEISPEVLIRIYKALGRPADGYAKVGFRLRLRVD